MSGPTPNCPASPGSIVVKFSGDRTLHAVDTGGEGPVLVLLHGFTDSWRSFEPLFPVLSASFRVLAIDQRGHGNSDCAETYSIASFKDDAIAFLETVVKRPVHLVGHSLGSIVAQRVAASRPDLLQSLILIGAARGAAAHPDLRALRDELASFKAGVPRDFIEGFQRSTTQIALEPAQLEIFVDESTRLHPSVWSGVLDGLIDEPPDRPDPPADLPVLVIWGEEDSIFVQTEQDDLARAMPGSRAVHFPGVGHAPHWEVPNRVAAEIAVFVREQNQPEPTRSFGRRTTPDA